MKKYAEFETIYDNMIKTRTQIATSLGFDNYVAFADVLMNRWDYDRPMIETYRSEVLQKIVPVTQKLYQRQAQRNGLENSTSMIYHSFFQQEMPHLLVRPKN